MKSLSLKSRLVLLLSALMLIGVTFSGFVLYRQHAIAKRSIEVMNRAQGVTSRAGRIRESLSEIDRYSVLGELNQNEIERFRSLAQTFATDPQIQSNSDQIKKLREQFEAYVESLESPDAEKELVRARYDDVSGAVSTLIAINENYVSRMSERLQSEQQQAKDLAAYFLLAWFALILLAGSKIITILLGPLTTMANFLDHINVEDDLPTNIPEFHNHSPEVGSVAKSFERVLQRLQGYRHLNVRRLLIEKRQADIISASILDGIFLLREDEILFLNPVAERILGVSPNQSSRGVRLRSLADRDREEQKGVPALQRKPSGAVSVLRAVAQTMPVEIMITNNAGGDERKLSYLITAYPISYDLVEQVEHSVKAPVNQILDRFQANIMVVARDVTLVKESQEAKSHFLGTLSHEVKTPVTSLTMATRLLKKSIDQIPNAMHRNLINTCVEDVDRLRKLLEDLLTVSRFDTLTQRLEFQAVNFTKLVKHAVQSFQVQAAERGVELIYKTHSASMPLIVAMDPAKVTWALSNLLTNALRHTPRGGRVQVTLESPEDRVEVKIRDTGPGIDRGRQEKIFDKFNPFYDLRVGRTGGAGVGLAIAREIVVAHGGKIWVSSEPGSGAEFCFTLPKKGTPALKTDIRTENTSAGTATGTSTGISKGALSDASAGS